jgi:RNA polymerase sigma-70 factor (ECF subfamily)
MPLPAKLRLLRGGESESDLESRLRALVPKAERWVARELGPAHDHEEALQEALSAVALAFDAFDGRSAFETYAYRIVVRVARRFRKSERLRTLAVAPPIPDRVDPESVTMNREALRALHRALDRLPDRRRRAFVLCAVEGLTAVEAAELEGTRPATMRSRLRHARRELARLLSHDSYLCELMERRS